MSPRSINLVLRTDRPLARCRTAPTPHGHLSPFRPHDLRHTFAFNLAQMTGADAYELQRRLGHRLPALHRALHEPARPGRRRLRGRAVKVPAPETLSWAQAARRARRRGNARQARRPDDRDDLSHPQDHSLAYVLLFLKGRAQPGAGDRRCRGRRDGHCAGPARRVLLPGEPPGYCSGAGTGPGAMLRRSSATWWPVSWTTDRGRGGTPAPSGWRGRFRCVLTCPHGGRRGEPAHHEGGMPYRRLVCWDGWRIRRRVRPAPPGRARPGPRC